MRESVIDVLEAGMEVAELDNYSYKTLHGEYVVGRILDRGLNVRWADHYFKTAAEAADCLLGASAGKAG